MAFLFKHTRSKFFYAGFYGANGKRHNRSTKIVAMEQNRKSAQKIADEFEAAANVSRSARQVRKVITELYRELAQVEIPTASVQDFRDSWLERKRNEVKPSTLTFYSGKTDQFLTFLGDRANDDISSITTTNIIDFRDHLVARVTGQTTNQALKALRALFNDAKIEGVISDSPCEGVRSVRRKESEITKVRPFTIDELQAVLSIAPPEWRSMIMFGLHAMLRMADIGRLQTSNIDWKKKLINLRVGKTGKEISIPISKGLLQFLEDSKHFNIDEEGPIHPEAFRIISANQNVATLSRQFATLLSKAGLREPVSSKSKGKGREGKKARHSLNFHSLRHTGNSLMANAGIGRELRKSITGHFSDAEHEGYTHLEIEVRRSALDSIPDLVI